MCGGPGACARRCREDAAHPARERAVRERVESYGDDGARLDAVERRQIDPIAIVGVGCRFPGGVDSPNAFWHLVRAGRDPKSVSVPGFYPDNGTVRGDLYDPAGVPRRGPGVHAPMSSSPASPARSPASTTLDRVAARLPEAVAKAPGDGVVGSVGCGVG